MLYFRYPIRIIVFIWLVFFDVKNFIEDVASVGDGFPRKPSLIGEANVKSLSHPVSLCSSEEDFQDAYHLRVTAASSDVRHQGNTVL